MPLQAFVDESGGKGHSQHFILAGLIAAAEQWARFSDLWGLCLRQDPSIAYFKMHEAAGFSGQFHGFTKDQRDAKLLSLARIIDQCADIAIFSALDLEAHAKTWGAALSKPLNDPYFFPFHNVIMSSCFELWSGGCRDRFEIVFDEHLIFGPRARPWYPLVTDLIRRQEPEAYSILPIDPMFRRDDEFLPLQAADLFAWCGRKGVENYGQHEEFGWLLDEMPNITFSKECEYFDLDYMQSVLDEARSRYRAGIEAPEDLMRQFEELMSMRRTKRQGL